MATPVFVWAAVVMGSFAASKTYYLYYYVQLAVPLALLAGSLLAPWARQAAVTMRSLRLPYVSIAIGAAMVLLAAVRLPFQLQATFDLVDRVKPAYVDIGRALATTPPASRVLAFEPNYAFLGSRETAPTGDGAYLIDIHAYMLYQNLGIKGRSWTTLASDLSQRKNEDEQTLLWRQPAQEMVLGAFSRADYVIVDARARYLLAPNTIATLEGSSTPVTTSLDATLRKRR